MGILFSSIRTHEDVPQEVKDKVEPIVYTPASQSARGSDLRDCQGCGEPFFPFFTTRTNCDWCGGQFCTYCCPNRYLLRGNPACPSCTKRALRIKRSELLAEYNARSGKGRPTEVSVASVPYE
ncbi:hypothetical protein TRVL_03613 [Trypanosoma vivax]|uniref:FYVE-type domain-containing protein n=1 Tax=Trypanosoma vivax (strain Y486) TaxID=1055687 RepID=G0U832_TRYVY|nr:hypothetical protein TRVL_03613 [Trypanosoma vivax]CCC52041.1 conserved hypothetical protein [Trypanosoma vivax Y486]